MLRARFCARFRIPILWHCPARKSAVAPPESTTSRRRKRRYNCSPKQCATPNPLAHRRSSQPTLAASCNFAPAPPSTAPVTKSSMSSNFWTGRNHESPLPICGALLYLVTSLLLCFLSPKTTPPLPRRWGHPRKGRVVFRGEDCVDRFAVTKNDVENQFSAGGVAPSFNITSP